MSTGDEAPPSRLRAGRKSFRIAGLVLLSVLLTDAPQPQLGIHSAGAADEGCVSCKRSLVWKDTVKEDIDQFKGANLFVSNCRTERGR